MNTQHADLRRLQLVELESLVEFDRVCRANGIQYWITGGTLLGAIRHGGFIPWDDDIDVSIHRRDYTRLKSAMDRDLDTQRFFFQSQDTDPEYRFIYAKLRRNGTKYVRVGQEHIPMHTGVFMDIFLWDGVPNRFRRLHRFVCKKLKTLMWSAIGAKSAEKRRSRALYTVCSWIPHGFWFHIYLWLCRRIGQDTELVTDIGWPDFHKCKPFGFDRTLFDTFTEVEFEGHSFFAPVRWDEMLTVLYGDYMRLPPEDQRRGNSPASFMQL